ncbi:hypothetical protein [Spirosoma utsteinense]|uniref:Uncharacterized protein n=1 Tax=Spirosoma utsteinense TaxID=2585773 RepID=A0ABR6WDT2_9BACT|nr:hypothetical protein [Spirosoma utsteinense]MBC3789439.1 hypothetical protein [Spirosoma utsteinense]MBC3794716.1 hypothetical protein [Spirosoma utsteinense]
MVNIKHFLIDLQQGAYLDAAIEIPPKLAEETGYKRFLAALYLYYMAILILSGGVLAKLSGPLHLDFLKASLLTGVIPYFFYRQFLGPLIIKRFDFVLADAEKAKCVKLYRYVFAGAFGVFSVAIIIVICISTRSF